MKPLAQCLALAKKYKFSVDTAWSKLPEKVRDIILNGTGEEEIAITYDDGLRTYKTKKAFEAEGKSYVATPADAVIDKMEDERRKLQARLIDDVHLADSPGLVALVRALIARWTGPGPLVLAV